MREREYVCRRDSVCMREHKQQRGRSRLPIKPGIRCRVGSLHLFCFIPSPALLPFQGLPYMSMTSASWAWTGWWKMSPIGPTAISVSPRRGPWSSNLLIQHPLPLCQQSVQSGFCWRSIERRCRTSLSLTTGECPSERMCHVALRRRGWCVGVSSWYKPYMQIGP